ncbi:MAG: hypothetical protein HUU47_03475 [Bacteroidetes bacterium]|nr:hypothetical protein [Bacteroidota bacterium]
MTKKILTILFISTVFTTFGQINMADSTAQVVSYWEKGEKQNYTVTTKKIKLKGTDTTSNEITTYDVEITVLNQADKSYTIQWLYKNIKTNSTNPTIQKLLNITTDMKVIFKTDELGAFMEVVNWNEIKDYIQKATNSISKEFSAIPEMEKLLKQITATYSSKEAIESAGIKDIQQFHTFHGAKYKLGEVIEGQIKVPNIYGTEPFDSDFTIYLDEINETENNFIMRATQNVNKEQLTNATFDYLTKLANTLKITPPKREDLKDLKNEILTASRIHGTGWVVYSVQTTTVTSDNVTNIEELTIEIK